MSIRALRPPRKAKGKRARAKRANPQHPSYPKVPPIAPPASGIGTWLLPLLLRLLMKLDWSSTQVEGSLPTRSTLLRCPVLLLQGRIFGGSVSF